MSDLRRPLGQVLVALDLSPVSMQVLERAALLPVTRGSRISLFHVVPERSAGSEDEETQALARARRELEGYAARLSPRLGPGVDVVTSVVVGTPFVEIVRRAGDERADLLLLGRHGYRTFADALIGSTAERVFRKGSTPTLIVNRDAGASYVRALVAVDLSDTSRTATELALRLLDTKEEAEVCVIHADDGRAWDVSDAMLRFLSPFEGAGVRWKVVDRRGDARAVILAQAAAHDPDLLVLGTHGRSKLVQDLVGSVAEAVVRAAHCDVLVARPVGAKPRVP